MGTKFGLTKAPCFNEPGDFNCTSPYGSRIHPITGKQSFHSGIDGVRGDGQLASITSIAQGTIKEVGFNSARGNYIIIDHGNGVTTTYQHLANGLSDQIKKGTFLTKGSILGNMGSTGASTGAHLHLEVAVNGQTQNPAPFIKGEKTIEQLVAEQSKGGQTCMVELPVLSIKNNTPANKGSIMTLQHLLNDYNNAGLVVDGSFGPATDRSLRDYQNSRGLVVDGSCGPATWSRLIK